MNPFKRTDWLRELQLGIGIITVVFAVLGLYFLGSTVYGMATGGQGPVPVVVSVPVEHGDAAIVEAGPGLADRARLVTDDSATVEIDDPTTGEYVLDLLTWLPTGSVVIAILSMLYVLLRRARKADPFTRHTVKTLYAIGLVALVGGVVASFTAMTANFMLTTGVVTSATVGFFELPWQWALGAIAVFALASVIARGQQMREDLDGVI